MLKNMEVILDFLSNFTTEINGHNAQYDAIICTWWHTIYRYILRCNDHEPTTNLNCWMFDEIPDRR